MAFFTPRSVVRTLVEMLEPYKGRVYDPCCGSGGMFVQSEKFIDEHGGRRDDIAVYGQEINHTTWRLAKMNLAVQGIDADIRWNNQGSFHRDELPDLKADFILANLPFNIFGWGGEWQRQFRLASAYLASPSAARQGRAWCWQMAQCHPRSREKAAPQDVVEADVMDCMVALPGPLFYSTQIPARLWVLARDKSANGHRDRHGEMLFIDARKLGFMVDRVRREFSADDIDKIADTPANPARKARYGV